MIRTSLCDLLGIEHPIIQAAMGMGATSAELVAAVSNSGGMGSLAASMRPTEDLKGQLARIRELTDEPFAVNFLLPQISDEVLSLVLETGTRVLSFALADPGELVNEAHDAGTLVMHQVTTVRQAYRAAEQGVDIVVAQGAESGGLGGEVAASVLVPQVVDAVSPLPVVAAGGVFDGRGLAAALVLGAQGVNVGTRFIASVESPASEAWKRAILEAQSEESVKVEFANDLLPPASGSYPVLPRSIRSPFIDQWQGRRHELLQQIDAVQSHLMAAIRDGRFTELLPLAGQTAGAIHESLPVAEIIRRMVSEAEEALQRVSSLLRQ